MTALQEIIAKLERATGADRELDALLFIALEWHDHRLQVSCDLFPDQVKAGRIQEPEPTSTDPRFPFRGQGWREAPAFTASLDAAIGLVERLLPGCWWQVESEQYYDNGVIRTRFVGRLRPAGTPRLQVEAVFSTPALALLLALCRALEQQGER